MYIIWKMFHFCYVTLLIFSTHYNTVLYLHFSLSFNLSILRNYLAYFNLILIYFFSFNLHFSTDP